jgi:hypothetical protein
MILKVVRNPITNQTVKLLLEPKNADKDKEDLYDDVAAPLEDPVFYVRTK